MKRKALCEAMKDKLIEDRAFIVDFGDFNEIKTKRAYEFLKKAGFDKEKVLFILNKDNQSRDNIIKSIRNLSAVEYDYSYKINAYEILKVDKVLIDKGCFGKIKEIWESGNGS